MKQCPLCNIKHNHAHFSDEISAYVITVLAEIYRYDYNKTPFYVVAEVCDNKLDKSGALLGQVREKALELNKLGDAKWAEGKWWAGKNVGGICPDCKGTGVEPKYIEQPAKQRELVLKDFTV